MSQLPEMRAAWARLQQLAALSPQALERAALLAAASALLAWPRLPSTAVALLMGLGGKAALAGCTAAGMLRSLVQRGAAAEQLVAALVAPEDVADADRMLAAAGVQGSALAALVQLLGAVLSPQVGQGFPWGGVSVVWRYAWCVHCPGLLRLPSTSSVLPCLLAAYCLSHMLIHVPPASGCGRGRGRGRGRWCCRCST